MPSPREVIERARKGLRPRPDATADGWARLQARLQDADDVQELPRVPAMEAPRGLGFVIAVLAIAAAIVLWIATRSELFVASEPAPQQQAPDRAQESGRVEVVHPASPVESEVGGEVPAPFAVDREPPSPPKSRPRAKAQPPADTLAVELALLQRAKQALARGEAESALASVREHARAHPKGELAEERFATHVRALCALDRLDDAGRVASEFAAAFPGSGVAQALRDDPCEKKE